MKDKATYEISVLGTLGGHWSEWFPEIQIQNGSEQDQPITRLYGEIPDQSSLIGMLQTLVNLGLPILLVKRIDWE